jgi:hypothetical protein
LKAQAQYFGRLNFGRLNDRHFDKLNDRGHDRLNDRHFDRLNDRGHGGICKCKKDGKKFFILLKQYYICGCKKK